MNKGVALLLAIIILTAVLGIALTAAIVFVNQIKMARNIGDSMIAYYAAESGIECELYKIKNPDSIKICENLPNVDKIDTDGATYIKVIGKYNNTKRAIEIILNR